MLIDGVGKPVGLGVKAIKAALLGHTNIVMMKDDHETTISYFHSAEGDEIDVSNGHVQDVYEPDQIERAINSFLNLVLEEEEE